MSGIAPRTQLEVPLTLSIAIAILLVIASLPGVFVVPFYRDASNIIATDRGSDLFALVIAAPALVVASLYARRGSLRAQIVWLGLTAWTAYNYAVYAYGVNFTRLFLVYVALLGLSVFVLAIVLRRLDVAAIATQFRATIPGRVIAIYLWVVAVMFAALWLADVIPATLDGSLPSRLASLHTTSNAVEVNDLAFIIPMLVIAGAWVWLKRPAGYFLAGVMLGLATLTMAALIPGAPIFGGQAPDLVYSAVAAVSLLLWLVLLGKVKPAARTAPDGAKATDGRPATI